MLNDVLVFLKNSLNAYLGSGKPQPDAQEEQVTFLSGQTSDTLSFKLGSVSLVMINLEQENILRPADRYSRSLPNGQIQKVEPEIRLALYVLFVANYQQYEDSLRMLSAIIQFFQGHRVFGPQDSPELSEKIQQLLVELVTLSFADQNEVWSSLRLPYHPSVLYKVRMAVFQDEAPKETPAITEKSIQTEL